MATKSEIIYSGCGYRDLRSKVAAINWVGDGGTAHILHVDHAMGNTATVRVAHNSKVTVWLFEGIDSNPINFQFPFHALESAFQFAIAYVKAQ